MWCLAAVPVKWAICFTLLRIANGQKRYTIGIYGCMASIAIVLCATTIYEFFHCHPLQKNWMIMEGGSCNDQSIISGFSFALSAVSIFSDWFCAVVPIPLLWNVQMDGRIKLSVMGLLSLGVFASIAPLVRLSYTVHLGMTEDFLFNAMDVASWAQAELGLGIIVANLPPLRPLLEKVLSLRSTLKSSDKRSKQKSTGDRYLELEEGVSTTSKKQKSKISHKGPQTRIYGGTGASNSSMEDDHSQKNIVPTSPTPEQQSDGIMVDRQVHVEFSTSPTPHS
ncbi:hypothetical protein P280DRAFT_486325 [Massarina eburnea CBS 473.64]|uniref:Rhodopsin domain-containing protein n=1 Tax=Massarina eburnea CBS 473.64 TaxID=1395130 RepID=A0A6A6SID7_9PLEO|nr:hypothetical protein P280DRAFT_486325 [Massarina eburnea CBS 473.64]